MRDLLLPPEHSTHGLNKLRHHSYSQHNLGVLQSRLMDAGLALKHQLDLLDALIWVLEEVLQVMDYFHITLIMIFLWQINVKLLLGVIIITTMFQEEAHNIVDWVWILIQLRLLINAWQQIQHAVLKLIIPYLQQPQFLIIYNNILGLLIKLLWQLQSQTFLICQ
jgi:hypothetical protein